MPQSILDAVTRPLPFPPLRTWNSTVIVVGSWSLSSLSKRAPAHVGWSSTVTVHVFPSVDLQPVQSWKVWPGFGVAVSVTVWCAWKLARHSSCVQLIPDGELVTLPLTSPFESLDSRTPSCSGENVATIVVRSWSSVTVQLPVPGQSGVLQPEKLLPESGFAVRVTVLPDS